MAAGSSAPINIQIPIKHCYGIQKSTGLVLVLYTQTGMNDCAQASMK